MVWTWLAALGLGCLVAAAAVSLGLGGGLFAAGVALLVVAWDGRH